MAGRLPFNLPNHSGQNPLNDPQIRAALGLSQVDEALYLQQQRELQRDFQLRQLLLQDQLNQQSQLDSMVVEQRIKQLREQLRDFPELQQHYTQLLLQDRLQRGQEESNLFARAQLQKHEELQRQALAQSQAQSQQHVQVGHQQAGGKARPQESPGAGAHAILRDIAADSLAGNAVKRSELEKRVFAKPSEEGGSAKKRPRAGTEDSGEGDRKKKKKKEKVPKKGSADTISALAELGKAASEATKMKPKIASKQHAKLASPKKSTIKPSAQALLEFAALGEGQPAEVNILSNATTLSPNALPHGTLADLLQAADSDKKTDDAASVLTKIKTREHVEWPESEIEEDDEERMRAIERGDTIMLPNFTSILPQLPEEPEVVFSPITPSKKKRKKQKSLMDNDSVDSKPNGKARDEKTEDKQLPGQKKLAEAAIVEYPYPVDTWWPTVAAVRKERKANGEPPDEDSFEEDEPILGPDIPFRVNMSRMKELFAQDVKPGVLEKVPHCRVHRTMVNKKKNTSALVPELVHCFQVTELYPNEIMVCCSHCGTWRHTACGGHYKPYSVRECIDSPFTAVCDRCHAEEKIIRDHPVAKKRIDRQRSEQIRRGLATSAAMRQASFSKHGGTYKWPLGSVSATHIGGHTRSVHSRHDKAEKQWMEMAQRLAKSHFCKLKDRTKVRTKELERLLVSVEDAEGHTDRHNMMLFLLQDTLKGCPSGFEKRRRNIFDPEEDEVPIEAQEPMAALENGTHHDTTDSSDGENHDVSVTAAEVEENSSQGEESEDNDESSPSRPRSDICAMEDCYHKPRFDSVFCSDACGVASLESDLLRTFHYTSDIHPSLLRS